MKPYLDLNTYYRNLFGSKTAKISLDGGFTCPNRDGTLGFGGCLFCSEEGSGDFSTSAKLSIAQQIQQGKQQTAAKWENPKYIAYFQAYTNTYAPASHLDKLYTEAITQPDIVGISIATRPDCLPPDVLDVLSKLQTKTKVWVELGLQTANETSAQFIRRGYPNAVFEKAVADLHERNIEIVAHTIIGLPNETSEDIYQTIAYLNRLPIQGIKLHLLHILSHTGLANLYQRGAYTPLTKELYIDIICGCIARLRPDIVIHRLTGDGNAKTLLAPLWSLNKRDVLNTIHKELRLRQIHQGDCYQKPNGLLFF